MSWILALQGSAGGEEHLLDVFNGVALFDIQSNRLAGQGLDENLHIYLSTIL